MSVYVDDVRHCYGRMIMCHMRADTREELLSMADKIGVARRWIQEPLKASWVHFDVSLGAKAKAIAAGAILTDKYGPKEFLSKLDLLSEDQETKAKGERWLAQIKICRDYDND